MTSPKQSFIGLIFVLLSFAIVSAVSAAIQPRIDVGNGLGWDGVEYASMAKAVAEGNLPSGRAVHAHRIGTPFLVGLMHRFTQLPIINLFFGVNLIAAFVSSILLYFFFLRFVGPWFSALGVSLFLAAWHAPLRFIFFYPVYVDPWFWVFWIGSLILAAEPLISRTRIVTLGLLSFVGTLFYQIIIVVPLSLLLSSDLMKRSIGRVGELLIDMKLLPDGQTWQSSLNIRQSFAPIVALSCSFAALLTLNLLIHSAGTYSYWKFAVLMLYQLNLINFLVAIFVAYGPILAILILRWRSLVDHLIEQPAHLAILMIVTGFGIVGGRDTLRYLYWASPIILLLSMIGLKELSKISISGPKIYLAIMILLVLQLISSLSFWPLDTELLLTLMNRDHGSMETSLVLLAVHSVTLLGIIALFRVAVGKNPSYTPLSS